MQTQNNTYTYTYQKLIKGNEGNSLEDARIAQVNHKSREPRTSNKVPLGPLEQREVNHGAVEPSHEPYTRFTPPFLGEVRPRTFLSILYIRMSILCTITWNL